MRRLILNIYVHLDYSSGWISFGVADWHSFQRFNGSTKEFYGLWAYCQEQTGLYNTVCKRWPTAEDQLFNGSRPNFIRTSEGLITTGMILLSLGLITGFFTMALPLLTFAASLLALLAFIFLVIGLPIFGRQSDDFSVSRGDAIYNKRYGFWLMVPTIVLEFLAILCFLGSGILYKLHGFGNLATKSFKNAIYGGMRMAGIPNMIAPPAYGIVPQTMNIDGLSVAPRSSSPSIGLSPPITTLLSEYLRQRTASPNNQTIVLQPLFSGTTLPQPSIMRSLSVESLANAIPAYVRAEPSSTPSFSPIINLTGRTIFGPVRRLS